MVYFLTRIMGKYNVDRFLLIHRFHSQIQIVPVHKVLITIPFTNLGSFSIQFRHNPQAPFIFTKASHYFSPPLYNSSEHSIR